MLIYGSSVVLFLVTPMLEHTILEAKDFLVVITAFIKEKY